WGRTAARREAAHHAPAAPAAATSAPHATVGCSCVDAPGQFGRGVDGIGEYLRRRLGCIDDPEPRRLGRGALTVSGAYPFEEAVRLALDAVGCTAPRGTGTAGGHGKIQQQGHVRRHTGASPLLQRGDALHGLAAAAALV